MIEEWKADIQKNGVNYDKFLLSLQIIESKEVDKLAGDETAKTYKKIDCLDCANCCKSAPTVIQEYEIKRIAKHIGISKKAFSNNYLIEDINGELTMNRVPCPFLAADNTCNVYDVRPEVCRKYPHTDQGGFLKKIEYHRKNISYCPITTAVVKNMMQSIQKIK
jgi:hypothetical protein